MSRALGLAIAIVAALAPGDVRRAPATFHHLHLAAADGLRLADFYARLFSPSDVARFVWDGNEVVQTGRVRLVIALRAPLADDGPAGARAGRSAIWHYGWGDVSLGESYLDHNRCEVAWEPPLPTNALHLHVESANPDTAATWYQDRLGARVERAAPFEERAPRNLRRPHAIVWIEPVALVLYEADGSLRTTRGRREDHIAVQVNDLDGWLGALRAAGVDVIEPVRTRGGLRTAMVEGPDRLAIELVEQQG